MSESIENQYPSIAMMALQAGANANDIAMNYFFEDNKDFEDKLLVEYINLFNSYGHSFPTQHNKLLKLACKTNDIELANSFINRFDYSDDELVVVKAKCEQLGLHSTCDFLASVILNRTITEEFTQQPVHDEIFYYQQYINNEDISYG
ncbi:MAG: hypothetical protein HAW67_06295 [Endozoicomonadaceae bacterium]|nr:hypothetical protein [Endozoicomonadaceae bacterium]